MNYRTRVAGTSRNRRCRNFCSNVCTLFSNGRSRCLGDCLACRRRPKLRRPVKVSPVRPCGCR